MDNLPFSSKAIVHIPLFNFLLRRRRKEKKRYTYICFFIYSPSNSIMLLLRSLPHIFDMLLPSFLILFNIYISIKLRKKEQACGPMPAPVFIIYIYNKEREK